MVVFSMKQMGWALNVCSRCGHTWPDFKGAKFSP